MHFAWLSHLFWASDSRTQLSIELIVVVASAFLLFVYAPLRRDLGAVRKVRRRAKRAVNAGDANGITRREAVAKALKYGRLSRHWESFSRQWRNSQAHDERSPVRFASTFEEAPLMPSGWRQSLLPAIPGVFVAMGVFGTFVGLTLAIPHPGAHAASTSAADTAEQIQKLTSSLGLAFRTSLWGLSLSVFSVLGIKHLEGNFDKEEEEIDRVVHLAYEWIGEGEMSARALREQKEGTDRLRKELTEVTMELQNVLTSGLDSITASAANTASSVSEELVKKLGQALQDGVSAHVESLRSTIEATIAVQEEIGTGLALAFEQMRGSTEAHRTTVERLHSATGAIEQAAQKLGETTENFAPTVAQLNQAGQALEQTSQAMSETQLRAGEAVETVRSTLVDAASALEQQRELVEGTLAEMKEAISRLSEGLSDDLIGALRSVDEVLGKALTRLGGTILDSSSTIDRMGPAFGQMLETVKTVEQGLSTVDGSVKALGEGLGQELRPIGEINRELGDSTKNLALIIEKALQGIERSAGVTSSLERQVKAEGATLRAALKEFATPRPGSKSGSSPIRKPDTSSLRDPPADVSMKDVMPRQTSPTRPPRPPTPATARRTTPSEKPNPSPNVTEPQPKKGLLSRFTRRLWIW